mmetsp:Transcript_107/g.117  ORF Transcript_107/g.117 Transcript_107/m.117 type:complete len:85 (+) Transcript_107:1381-1635(+)
MFLVAMVGFDRLEMRKETQRQELVLLSIKSFLFAWHSSHNHNFALPHKNNECFGQALLPVAFEIFFAVAACWQPSHYFGVIHGL